MTEAKAQEYRWLEARFLLVLVTQRERVGAPAAIVPRVPLPRALLYAGRRVEGDVAWTGRVYRDWLSDMGTEIQAQEYRWLEARG